ncbi:hypothetical protein [Pyrococcus kukulkanii]|uniref:Uncharacterized protein n=1 Tax=Pyrococcus kukulkanii TaxID=1609559 RepID=A0ABV4T512_9EURY
MTRKLALLALLFILLAVLPLIEPPAQAPTPDTSAMRTFLQSQYVPEVGLLRASVTSYPDNETIWLANDNILAVRALKLLNSTLWRNVSRSLATYGVSYNGRVDPLLGRPLDGFYCPEVKTLGRVNSGRFNATFTLKLETANRSCVMRDWRSYADLVVYGALSDILQGKRDEAFRLYFRLLSMWDGNGFRDRAFSGVYQSYKCALFVYLYRALGEPGEGRSVYLSCSRILTMLQSKDGRIVAGYKVKNGRIIPIGDPNTETTSVTAIAFLGFPKDD